MITKQEPKTHEQLCRLYLTGLFADIQHHEPHQHRKITQIEQTYGEILYPGIEKMIAALALTKNDIFFDLGSGMGKLAAHFFLRTPVNEVCGIELLPELHDIAIQAGERIYSDLPEFYQHERKLTFTQGDILRTPLTRATVALIASPCFPLTILDPLGEIIDNTPSIHTFLTLKPIRTLKRLKFKKALPIQCSWDSALCYVYLTQTS